MINVKSKIATGIILFISLTAFIAGYIQTTQADTITNLRKETADLQDTLERMELKALSLVSEDMDSWYTSQDFKKEAQLFDSELKLVNSTLSLQERNVYLSWIVGRLQDSINYQNLLEITRLHHHFRNETSDCYYASRVEEGYEYKITYEDYQAYVNRWGNPVSELNTSQFYGYFFSYVHIINLSPQNRPRNTLLLGQDIFYWKNASFGIRATTEAFLFKPVYDLQTDITELINQANSLELQYSKIALGVSLTTIAVVLSAAMSNRIFNRNIENKFDKLREKGGTLKEKHDLLSIPVLVIAAIISLLGIAIPLLFT